MNWIKHLKTPLLAALAMAYGVVSGYEAAASNRIMIPDGMSIETIRAGIFVGGIIAAAITCLSIKAIWESSKIAIREVYKMARKR